MRRKRALIFLCALVIGLVSCASQTTIVNSVGEREANEIVVLLASKGIDAIKTATAVTTTGGAATTEQMWDISVPAKQITASLAILNQAGLPRVKGTTLLDLFGTTTLVPSDLQDRIRYQEGLSEQLANTIRKIDGIIDAEVQITLPQEESTQPLTASIYVKHHGILDNSNSLLISKIKRLIASAYPGLTVDNVTVVTDRAVVSDISLELFEKAEKIEEFVSIWGVVIAKDYTSKFRMIFYTFSLLVFLLLSSLTWLIWKFYPLIGEYGGVKSLFLPYQLKPGAISEEKIEKEILEEEKEEEGEEV